MSTFKEIEEVIEKAIKKVGGSQENDLCKYLPVTSGGYMHHFTLRKMKSKQPEALSSLIKKFIIDSERPGSVPPKRRAARGSRKRKDQYTFSQNQLEYMLRIARQTGNKEMLSLLTPKKSLATCKRELIVAIRHGKVEQELWNAYVEAQAAHNTLGEYQEAAEVLASATRD